MSRCLIALGANLGERHGALTQAAALLSAHRGINGLALSRSHETAPVGGPADQGSFLNAAAAFDTALGPHGIHELLKSIEQSLGRHTEVRWGPRTIDLDLLLFDDAVVSTATLSVPHPRMAFRRFVLAPAAEVAPAMIHPLAGVSVAELLAHLDAAAPYVALAGARGSGRARLAQAAAAAVGGTYLAASVDPSGHGRLTPIQFLDRAVAQLAGRDGSSEPGVVISDFWFDECLADARVELDEPHYEQFLRSFEAARRQVVAPKLLVVLDSWQHGIEARAAAPSGGANAADRRHDELLMLAARRQGLPVLYAGDNEPQAQLNEITAAIAAMQ